MSEPLLKVENLVQHFPVSRTYTVKAVNGVSFNIYPGETYGLVGESGSGKTTIGRSIIRLYNPTDGRITFNGKVISGALDRNTRSMLRSDMQMIFQDPMASLNPRKKVGDIISEGMEIHHRFANRQEREEKISRNAQRKSDFAGARSPLSAPVFRRSASARRHCPRPDYEPQADYR